eukprot:CAMPEP_0184385638 /NCGR_PEP_ID=MMETSP0007-20130409/9043_1 /TAXON_ID=97485 /ORGANISM="Prymnesium parvum, Strain Texoma1" /LENGTH=81 /DNA_ID=CAMNT_0026733109 /DNA_START=178 /DNA_END=420 /DNA_ORIENTATION=+
MASEECLSERQRDMELSGRVLLQMELSVCAVEEGLSHAERVRALARLWTKEVHALLTYLPTYIAGPISYVHHQLAIVPIHR